MCSSCLPELDCTSATSSSHVAAKLQMSEWCRPALGEAESSVDTARVPSQRYHVVASEVAAMTARRGGRVFECKTCGKRFPTFQALGGHRASHRRRTARTARAMTLGDLDAGGGRFCRLGLQAPEAHGGGTAGTRLHVCPVCGVEFAIGQALGGHMRRHCLTADANIDAHGAVEATSVKAGSAGDECAGRICLDLNLTPSENCAKCRNAGLGSPAQRTLLFGCFL